MFPLCVLLECDEKASLFFVRAIFSDDIKARNGKVDVGF